MASLYLSWELDPSANTPRLAKASILNPLPQQFCDLPLNYTIGTCIRGQRGLMVEDTTDCMWEGLKMNKEKTAKVSKPNHAKPVVKIGLQILCYPDERITQA